MKVTQLKNSFKINQNILSTEKEKKKYHLHTDTRKADKEALNSCVIPHLA